ncbi:MAG: MmgE/PrpD family protein, partial [Rhodospirillales bacterium]|nr:MmgE/PrpD family protein [Rhodospirillales bacterium]
VRLWNKVSTVEDPDWTRRYHEPDPNKRAFGGRIEINFKNGTKLVDELAVANAHSAGARPFARADYIRKFETLTEGLIDGGESRRFLDLVQRLPDLTADEVGQINIALDPANLTNNARDSRGIF